MSNRRAMYVLIAALVVFAFFSIRNSLRARETMRQQSCLNQQMAMEGAKEQYAIEHDGKGPQTIDVLIPNYIKTYPVCPDGGQYALGDLQLLVSCDYKNHTLPMP